ncbi:MAG: phosphoglycerate kinase [Sphingobacteriia bacterium]|nr:phosphoglycerate kinase [Sphingobacteriia bacterium]
MIDFTTLNLSGKKVLLRLDINLPIIDGEIKDKTRLKKSLPTLLQLLKQEAIIIILTHLGRPKGKIDLSLSVKPIFEALKEELKNTKVSFAENFDILENQINGAKKGEIILFENIRFFPEEEKGDDNFAKRLASFADIYINDAFSCCHRAHASISFINKYLDSAPGLLLREEVRVLEHLMQNPKKPFVGIIGGSKVSTKIELLKSLVTTLDVLIIGGAMANTFFMAEGKNVGSSLVEPEFLSLAKEIQELAKKNNCNIVLPIDFVVATEISENVVTQYREITEILPQEMMLDIGDKTLEYYKNILKDAKTVIWNGPVGAYEFTPFANGSITLAKIIAEYTKNNNLLSVAGGGDVVAAINKANVAEEFSYISTAGGAFLEWLEGKKLPGLEAFKENITQ